MTETLQVSEDIVRHSKKLEITLLELYGFVVWEGWLAKALSSIHPKQFLFSIVSPGLSTSIGLLQQNYTCLNNYCMEDPDIDYYEEMA